MQKQYLAKHPDTRIQVYAIWFTMQYGDSRQAWDSGLLTDSRAQNCWDEERFAGRYYANGHGVEYGAIYDFYAVYRAGAKWGDPPLATGQEFAYATATLQKALDAATSG